MSCLTYIIDEEKIKSNINKNHKYGDLIYPIKTNDSFEIIAIIDKYFTQKDSYLISSRSHYSILELCEISKDRMIYTNVCSSFETLEEFYSLGIRDFIFGDFRTLRRFIYSYKNITVGLRLSLNEFDDNASMLGMSKDDLKMSISLLNKLDIEYTFQIYFDRKVSDKKGLFYSMYNYIRQFKGYSSINFGGYIESIANENLIYEVGENLLKNAVSCEVEVEKILDNNIIFLNTGVYAGLLDIVLYNKKFSLEINGVLLSKRRKKDCNIQLTFYGSTCDTKDIVGTYYVNETTLKDLHTYNYITILDTGAYCDVFKTRYSSDLSIAYRRV